MIKRVGRLNDVVNKHGLESGFWKNTTKVISYQTDRQYLCSIYYCLLKRLLTVYYSKIKITFCV